MHCVLTICKRKNEIRNYGMCIFKALIFYKITAIIILMFIFCKINNAIDLSYYICIAFKAFNFLRNQSYQINYGNNFKNPQDGHVRKRKEPV